MFRNNLSLSRNHYRVYGLNIESEIELPELVSINNVIHEMSDVSISYGSMPEVVKIDIERGQRCKFSKNQIWFCIKETAIYYICNGKTIVVEPYNNYDEEKVRIFLLGSALGMLLIQRNIVAIHGSAIEINGRVVVITGESGSGKSTLAAAFLTKGYAFLADDVSAVTIDKDEEYLVNPAYPKQKLCLDAIKKLELNMDKFLMIDTERNKFSAFINNNFINHSAPLRTVIELSVGDVNIPEINKVQGMDKLRVIIKNIYRTELLNYIGFDQIFFKSCIDLASKVEVYRIIRPNNGFYVEQQIDLISGILI